MASKIVFIDANIIMYTVGTDHPLKTPCQEIVKKITSDHLEAVTDTEVFQEILYRYHAQGKKEAGVSTYNDFRQLVSLVFPITIEDMDNARDLLIEHPALTPRDSIHVAVMKAHGIRDIYTADRHFDKLSGIKRLGP